MSSTEEVQVCVGQMFSSESQDGEHCLVHCPACGGNYVHLDGHGYYDGNDRGEAGHVLGIGVRGDVLVIRFWGECGHEWGMVFGEHKGTLNYDIVEVTSNE